MSKRKVVRIAARELKVGDVFMESGLMAARILRIRVYATVVTASCRYTSPADTEPAWPQHFAATERVWKVR